jgi:hypothetical protein
MRSSAPGRLHGGLVHRGPILARSPGTNTPSERWLREPLKSSPKALAGAAVISTRCTNQAVSRGCAQYPLDVKQSVKNPEFAGLRARSSVGERSLHTREVGGSKPPVPIRSKKSCICGSFLFFGWFLNASCLQGFRALSLDLKRRRRRRALPRVHTPVHTSKRRARPPAWLRLSAARTVRSGRKTARVECRQSNRWLRAPSAGERDREDGLSRPGRVMGWQLLPGDVDPSLGSWDG